MSGEEYKQLIIELVKKCDESEKVFLIQVYTIIKKHLQRRGR